MLPVPLPARKSERPSKAMDIYIGDLLRGAIRHRVSWHGTGDLEDPDFIKHHFVAFNTCSNEDDWNLSLQNHSPRSMLKGDLLVISMDPATHEFKDFTWEEWVEWRDVLRATTLSNFFPNMKNVH